MIKWVFIILLATLSGAELAAQSATPRLWHGLEREVRYHPEGKDIVIQNGWRRFNRGLYGTNTAFRVEAGDLPEFAMYMPGMGGNLRFGLLGGGSSKWLIGSQSIRAVYRPGSMIYTIKDPLLGAATLDMAVLAMADAEGLILRVRSSGARVRMLCVFGGASGKKFSRDGDIGADPESSFYLQPGYCSGNQYTIKGTTFHMSYGSGKALEGVFPSGAVLSVANAWKQDSPSELLQSAGAWSDANAPGATIPPGGVEALAAPVLTAPLDIDPGKDYYFLIRNSASRMEHPGSPEAEFARAEQVREELAGRVEVNTPDPYINTLGGALAVAADGIWEYPSYLHGAVAWRIRLNGWRGPYAADPLGWHDRARTHFSSYALSQLTRPEDGPVVPDQDLHLARQLEQVGTAMFSSGYICRDPGGELRPNHYDMNLVFIDELLDHFLWTGDTAYIRQMWPVLQRHLSWEKRNFDSDGDGLYDAYCCIWASDALEYSGGGVTHSSAYNYRANAIAAQLASLIGEDPSPYRQEADKILHAINTVLWMPAKGWYAEYIDHNDGYPRNLHPAAGLWTIYHAIDSRVPDAFQTYQALRYVDTEIPHIPVRAKGLSDSGLYTLSTTNWLPYTWSVNNVVLAESLHTALAYWQGGRPEEAYPLWKGALVESMYLGASPGNFQQLSFYDAMKGELYRDFADPIGMAARSLVEGLFGIHPDALADTLTISPGWPMAWDHASLRIPDIGFDYTRVADEDRYTIRPALPKKMSLLLRVRARTDAVGSVTVNGVAAGWRAVAAPVNGPMLEIVVPPAKEYAIAISWKGKELEKISGAGGSGAGMYRSGDRLTARSGKAKIIGLFDPQGALSGSSFTAHILEATVHAKAGNPTVFIQVEQGQFSWWRPFGFQVLRPVSATAASARGNRSSHGVKQDTVNAVDAVTRYDTIGLSAFFNQRVDSIFKNEYSAPRVQSPTLRLPWQGVGNWCYPLVMPVIDDAGLRARAGEHNEIILPQGIPLATPGEKRRDNILFTSRWDNFPDSAVIPLKGRASHAWFLMAGTTNPMQSRITNGVIDIHYKDGSSDELELNNPETWWPIEQDYYEDGFAFSTGVSRPVRVYLKTGDISDKPEGRVTIKGFSGTGIDGGAATVLDMPLRPEKELDKLVLKTVAQEVVIGLMSLTLARIDPQPPRN